MLRKVSPFILHPPSTLFILTSEALNLKEVSEKSQDSDKTDTPMLDVSLCILSITFPFHPELLLATFLQSVDVHGMTSTFLLQFVSSRRTTDGGALFFPPSDPCRPRRLQSESLCLGMDSKCFSGVFSAFQSCFGTTILSNILGMR